MEFHSDPPAPARPRLGHGGGGDASPTADVGNDLKIVIVQKLAQEPLCAFRRTGLGLRGIAASLRPGQRAGTTCCRSGWKSVDWPGSVQQSSALLASVNFFSTLPFFSLCFMLFFLFFQARAGLTGQGDGQRASWSTTWRFQRAPPRRHRGRHPPAPARQVTFRTNKIAPTWDNLCLRRGAPPPRHSRAAPLFHFED